MREHPLRALLSRLLHGQKPAPNVELVYRHRGVPEDQLSVLVSTISRVGKGWFMLSDGETQIPYHRVLVVKNLQSGEILWEKRKRVLPGQAP